MGRERTFFQSKLFGVHRKHFASKTSLSNSVKVSTYRVIQVQESVKIWLE